MSNRGGNLIYQYWLHDKRLDAYSLSSLLVYRLAVAGADNNREIWSYANQFFSKHISCHVWHCLVCNHQVKIPSVWP